MRGTRDDACDDVTPYVELNPSTHTRKCLYEHLDKVQIRDTRPICDTKAMHPFPARRAKQFPVSDGAVSEEVIRRFCRNNHSLSLRSLGPSAALREVDKKSLFTRPIPLSPCFAGHFSPGPIINERKHIINSASLSLSLCRRRGMIPHPPLHLCQSLTGERTEGREDPCHVGIDSAALSFSSEFLHNFFHLLLPMTGPNRRRKSTCTHTAIVMPSVLTHCLSLLDFV